MSEFLFPAGYDAARWLSHERQQNAKLLVLHEPHRRVRRCAACQRRLDTARIWSMDCGNGECLECVIAGVTQHYHGVGIAFDVVDVSAARP